MKIAVTSTRARNGEEEEEPVTPGVNEEVEEVPIVVEIEYEPVLHTSGSLPKPSGSIPPTFNAVTFADQQQTSLDFYSFLQLENPPLLRLNEGDTVFTALGSIPKTRLVKVVFCLGTRASPIDMAASLVDEKLLLLHGDGLLDIAPSPLHLVPTYTCDNEDRGEDNGGRTVAGCPYCERRKLRLPPHQK